MAKTGVLLGIVGHYWYKVLDHKFPGTSGRTLTKKLLLEMVAGPPFALLTFVCLGMFENKSLNTSLHNYRDNFAAICLVNICNNALLNL
jgi:hypothetical protein